MSAAHQRTDDVAVDLLTRRTGHRLVALDVLRGLAILGTLLTNIWIFSNAGVTGLDDLGSAGAVDGEHRGGALAQAVNLVMGFVTDGKWIGLLTIMFGIGLEIQRQSALRRGETWPGTYPWRAGLLIVEGALNYLFIFEFDVLMGYGLTGLIVAAVLATSPKAQKIWLGIGLTLHLLLIGGMSFVLGAAGKLFAGQIDSEGPVPSEALLEDVEALPAEPSAAQLRNIAADHGVEVSWVREMADSLAVGAAGPHGTESYWAMVRDRALHVIEGRAEIPIMVTMGLGLFLIGAMLYRRGLFTADRGRLRGRLMIIGFGVGLPLDILCRTVWTDLTGGLTRYGTSAMVAFGVLALVAAFYVRRRRTGVLGTGLSWVGRTAMTCYVLQNLICSIIFYDFGFGLARKMPAEWNLWGTLLVYAGICLLLIAGAGLWLRFFSRGPLELVMHHAHRGLVVSVHEPMAARRRRSRLGGPDADLRRSSE